MAEVLVYGTARCPYCIRARRLLEKKGVAYEDIRLEEQPDKREEMEQRSQRRTVPQIFIDGTHIGGSDELHKLEYAGELDLLLRKK
ncbi:MAG: glutaredoxin 3 [Gammaproteobacteria bacterium]|nr:glutaredoxin 3 [Gammaproteobacteria bacterium]NNF67510.1 glutaredoxin 3 [Gammaproteobacteria bacterium]